MRETAARAETDFLDPGRHGAVLDALPRGPRALCAIVQGLLLHGHYGLTLYGEAPPEVAQASRETLPVAARLDAILAADPAPLTAARAPFARQLGTCRDFALLLAGFLRHQGTPARLRCGFADYFAASRWEDHWVCEYRTSKGWVFADAQLDAAHRSHLGLDFDPADLPAGRFRPAQEIWRACRAGEIDPEACGHGETTGLWFLQVNLRRDLLALDDRIVSEWDAWRAVPEERRRADPALCDRLAAAAVTP